MAYTIKVIFIFLENNLYDMIPCLLHPLLVEVETFKIMPIFVVYVKLLTKLWHHKMLKDS